MKLKQFIFALVAMLSFSFSAFAQTVTTAADLKAALNSTGAVVTLGGNITMAETISIPSGVSVTLDLNGKSITTSAACDVFEVIGTMVINDSKGTGSVTGKTDRVLYVKTKGQLTINGGRFFKNSGRVVYSGGKLIINGGSVESTPVAIPNVNTATITGAGGTVELNGGTVTSIAAQACDLKIAGATVEAGVNILKTNKSTEITAGTINGDITVATEAADNVTISGGTFKDTEAVSKYMEEGKAVVKNEDGSYSVVDGLLKITSTGKCYPSLGDAFDAAVAGDVITLLDDVRVDDKYPTNQSEGITLDINGYTLSSYNNIHRVFDNGENGDITIIDSKKTGKIVGYSIRNKGQMTVNGVRLEFEDGLDCRGGDLYVDGCTIIGKKFAMQNDGGNTTVRNTTLSAETYAIEHRVYGASKTFTIGEGVVIESGKVHTYDIDPGQNIVFPEGYFAATIQKYQTSQYTRAYYYCALPAAVEAVKDGGTVQVLSDVELKDILTLDKAVTLDGNGKTLTSTAGRAINVDCAGEVTIENLTIAGATGCERGINIINQAGTTNVKKVNVSGVSYYAVHVATSAGAAQVNIENSNLTGWAAVAAYGAGGTINVKDSYLVGVNTYAKGQNFATIAAASNIAVNVTGGKVTAESFEGKGNQNIVCGDRTGNVTTGASFTLDTDLELKGTAGYVSVDLDNNTVTVRKEYGTNYVTTPAGNGLVNLTSASEAEVDGVKYAKLEAAFAAATEGQTITLIADVTPSLTSQRAITKAAVIDLGGKTLTLKEDDLYFGTTTFKNGTIVVDPSVKPSTAVFWMFENQALAFDNVDIVATGVTGTYLIGINGGTGTTVDIINGSSITIDNESKANLTAVICDNGTGNTVTIKDSDIAVNNIEGRFYLGGKNGAVVVENTDVDLNGVKEGFYLRAGQSLAVTGTTTVDITLNTDEGRYGINVTDATAKYNKAETATVNATVFIPTVAMIGTQSYASLEDAVAAAKAGDEIKMYLDATLAAELTLPADITFNGNGKQVNGTIYAGGNLTFAGHTKVTTFSASYYDRVITIGEGACLEVTGTGRVTLGYGNTFNITGSVENAKTADKANVKPSLIIPGGISITGGNDAVMNVTNAYVQIGSTTSKNSAANGTFNMNFENSIVEFTNQFTFAEPTSGKTPTFNVNIKNSVFTTGTKFIAAAPNSNVVVDNSNVTLGTYFRNSGKFDIVNGSVFTGATIQFGENGGNDGAITVDNSELTITASSAGHALDGKGTGSITLKNGAKAAVDYVQNMAIKVEAEDYEGLSVTEPTLVFACKNVVAESVEVVGADATVDGEGVKVTLTPIATVGNTVYGKIDDAIAAWTNNTTLTLLADVTLSDVITLKSTEHHILNLGTYTMTAADGKNAIVIKACGTGSAERTAITINADAENPGGINAGSKCVIYYKYADGGISTEDRPIIKINGGVFTGSTSSFGTAGIYTIGTAARKCATLNITGGTFNCSINGSGKSKLIISGGVFNYSVGSQGDSTALRLISGGTFKTFGFMTADSNNTKFWFGTSMGNSNVGVHVDDNGYIVVGGAVVTEPGDKFEASSTNYSGASSLLQYSSAKDNGLYYTAVEEALADNNKASGEVTVYADEIDMTNITYKGTIIIPAGKTVTIANATEGLKVATTDGYFLNVDEYGKYTSMLAVAKVGDEEFETVQKALQHAIDNSAAEVVILTDVREKMVTDFELVIKANLTIKAADKFTAEAPAKVEFYNEGTSMDFVVGTAEGAERSTLTIAENVHFDLVDRVIWLGYYGNNVDVVVNGYLGGNQIWHGANTTVNKGGMLDSHGEAFIMRRDATLTANEGAKVKANYFQIYSGHINATGADITAGLVWVNNNHNYGIEGTVSFTLNKTTFTSNGEVKMYPGADKRIPVTVSNDSHFAAKGAMTLDNSVDVTVDATSSITHNNGQAFKLPVATINGLKYTSLQDAVNAVKNGEEIVLVDVVEENVTVVQAPDMAFTINGNGNTMKGTITVNGKSAAYATAGLTIKNVNFNADGIAAEACINLGVKGDNNNTRYTNGVTVDNCTFTGTNKDKAGIKNYTGGCKNVTITNSTATGMHSLAQFKTSYGVTLTKNTVTECKNGISVDGSTDVTVTECTVDVAGYGIRANGGSDVTVTSNNVKAFTPVVVRSVTANSSFTFNGENTMVAADETGKWMVIGDEEYEAGKTLPAESTANVVVALNDAKLSYTGIHGAGLAGKGTEAEPYLINNATELQMFRDKVNAGATKFNAPGVWVALNADIDLAGINWVGIGSMTADHGFMGNFDGKGFKIKNLTIENPTLDSDGYAYAGLFALTEGTDKDNQNVVKNLTIENVTINTTGDIVSAAIAYAYYTNVDNVKVCGDIKIKGGKYTAGVLAYTRRCVNASNLSIDGNEGSFVEGTQVVGGVISDIQMNGGLKAEYSNFSAKNIAVIGEQMVGGISGNIATQTLNGATVENVTLTSGDARVGTVAGCFGGTSTITDVTVNNVTGATAVIGATYNGAKAVEARIGDTYYETFAAAYAAAQASETVTMLVDLTMSEILVLDKAITLDGGNCKLTSTAARAINVSGADGVTIKNLTINASGERAINVIQNATNVTIENVTATAANYTVNLAGSAGAAKVVINNSNLTGLNVVNVAAAGSNVTISGGTIVCNDNTDAESYAALVLNKDAVGAKIAANGVTFHINGDSKKASNQAEGGIITIDGSADEVEQHVAYISYGNNWYGFATLEAAIAKANAGETVTLLRNITASAIITIDKAITLDGNGKTLTSTAGRAINVETEGNVTIENLTINAGERAINIINFPANVTVNNVTATAKNNAVMMATSATGANLTVNNSDFTGLAVVNVASAGSEVEINNTNITNVDANDGENYGAISIFKTASNATVVVNGGKVVVAGDSKAASIGAAGATVTFNGTEGNTEVQTVVAYIGDAGYTTLKEAIEDAKADDVITLISNVTMDYNARDAYETQAQNVVIDGNGKVLTLNQKNSDWASFGLANNSKLVLKNMTIEKTGYGDTSGAWNTHAIIFSCPVEMENVTVNNSVAVAADAAFTDVVFNEANGYYSLWIEANGQTVTVKGGSMTATNGGRGIKIADQYIDAPAKVTLSVDGTVFNTAKKAAVLVSSKAGAEITAANVNIENVAADKVNFVWVDGDWATYFGNVTVNGAPAVMEDAASFVAAVTVNGAVKAYYATIAKAIEAAQAGEEVALVADITASEVILLGKSVTINGNGHKVTSNATRVFRVTTSDTEVTLNNVNMVSTAVRVGTNDIRGISIDAGLQNVVMTLNNCSVDFTDPSANDWTYAVNVSGNGTDHTVTVNGGTYEGANVINAHGANNTITVKGATLTSTYPASDLYYGACFWVLQNQGSSVVAEGNTFEANNSIVFNVGTGTAVTESENVDNTKVYVAKVGTDYYHSVNEAINAAENGATVQLLKRTIDEAIAPWTGDSQHKLEKSITIQGYADFGTTLTGGMFLGYNDGTVRDNTITVKGINFVGKGVVVANQKNVVIEGNKFTGINALVSDKHANSNCAVLVIGTKNDMSIAATVKNNVIENVANAGIYLSQVGAVDVEDNTVTGTKHNALTVSAATTATVDVKNNTFAQWGLGGEGRAMRISGAATVNVNENVMSYEGTMPEEFVKVTGATAFDASANYWNGEYLLTEGLLAGVDPLTVARSYYTDAEKQNLVELTATKSVAKIGKTYYVTLDAAFKAVQEGETVNILAGTYKVPSMKAGITVEGAVNADGTPAVLLEGTLSNTLENLTLKNLHIKGGNAQRWAYAKGDLVFENVIFEATGVYALHFDGITAGATLTYKNCTIIGWAAMSGSPASCVFEGCTFKGNGTYGLIRTYFDATIENCTFDVANVNTTDVYQDGIHAVEGAKVVVNGCTNENGTMKDIVNIHGTSEVTVDGIVYKNVAKIADKNYITIEDAFAAWADGTTLTLLTDIALDTKTLVTECDGYASIVNVEGKAVTIDLNGKTITVDAAAADLADTKGKMLMAVFSIDEGGKLTINDSSDDKTGAVNVSAANDATVYSLAAAYGEGAQLTINNGSYYVDVMPEATSLIYAQRSESVIINGGTYNIGNVGTLKNGSPWIFNSKGQNVDGIYVYGGTYPTDINHQFWFNEAIVPGNLAVKANEDGTWWSVVEAVAYTNEVGRSTGSWRRNVGYATIEEAIAATQTRFCEDKVVTLAKNVEIEQMITVANGVEVTLDLNGKTLAATDNTSKNYSAIDNRGDLTIVDSSEDGTGKITVTATVNSGWNRYSAVIANNPGGELTVMSGTIEHLGGTDMAYGIDNLTNGKGTHAVTEIYGGTVKSPYRAVRQFLNGVEANNTLAVYGGTLEGANKSIWMQDPSKNANTGNLYVGEEAVLNGDVYLTVTAGSTEWPVEAYIEKAALAEGKTVLVSNVPADAAALVEYDTFWQVEQKNLAELTIVDEDYTEYINKIEKNVGVLTYERDFTGEWETIYLPFGFTITEDMAAEFDFAYIYNASYMGKQATFEFVEVGVGFNLAANYPYLVKAKEAGENEIVVENAKLMPTKVETIDCSSIFEKFSFIGNYATVDADNLDATMGYFSLNGTWSKMDVVNPFRFYMQIQLRNGDAFEYPTDPQAIRMRSVNAYGEETTGINGVDAEQAGDFIFDIHGRRVLETEKGGIYIKNGKKFIAQ